MDSHVGLLLLFHDIQLSTIGLELQDHALKASSSDRDATAITQFVGQLTYG